MSTFAELIAIAEATKAEQAAQAATTQARKHEVGVANALRFGRAVSARVTEQIKDRVLAGQIGLDDLKAVQAYVEAMLAQVDAVLPSLKATLRKEVEFVFVDELEVAHREHRGVPKSFFNGQRKLAERVAKTGADEEEDEAKVALPERIRYTPDARVKHAWTSQTGDAPVADKPATTPKGVGRKAKPRPGSRRPSPAHMPGAKAATAA